MEDNSLIVDGYVFSSYKEAQMALKEKETIQAIQNRIDENDADAMYQLYEKMVQRDMFKTIIGYSFLWELRHHLVTDCLYNEEDLSLVTLPKKMEYDKVSELNKGILESKIEHLLLIKKRMTIVIFALVFMIVVMFVIAAINPNAGYINVENKVLNKYSSWQENLEQRERAIKEKEAELNINDNN